MTSNLFLVVPVSVYRFQSTLVYVTVYRKWDAIFTPKRLMDKWACSRSLRFPLSSVASWRDEGDSWGRAVEKYTSLESDRVPFLPYLFWACKFVLFRRRVCVPAFTTNVHSFALSLVLFPLSFVIGLLFWFLFTFLMSAARLYYYFSSCFFFSSCSFNFSCTFFLVLVSVLPLFV